jgi:hypothetical protein
MTLRRLAKQVLKPDPRPAAKPETDNTPVYLKEYAEKSVEFERVYDMRKQFMVKVDQPLVMVSQVQRSGGTLMSQLFDGHPEVHAHPYELYIGYPEKYNYPNLDLSLPPEQWYELLYEKPSIKSFRDGYQKHPDSATYDKEDVFPFLLLPNLQYELFLHAVSQTEIKSQRDVLDCYWTSYFNAWLDYQNLYGEKKVVAGFVPRVNIDAGNVSRFFRDYPEGKLISVIRDPKGWYGSSHKKGPQNYATPQVSIPIWIDSAQAMIRNKQQYGDRVFLISFDTLLKDTPGVMRKLSDWIGLTWDDILTEPTFQRMPIKANTAFSTTQYGVIDAPLKRDKDVSEADAKYIDEQAADLYRQVLALVD